MTMLQAAIGYVLLMPRISYTLAEEPVWTYKHPDPQMVTIPGTILSDCPYEINRDIGGIIFTGPWRIVTYMAKFGYQGYFVNIPSKFISQDGKRFWLCYSANYTPKANWTDPAFLARQNPPGSTYTMSLYEVNASVPQK